MNTLQYFGTEVCNSGHFWWQVGKYSLHGGTYNTKPLPFDPECMPEYEKGERMFLGDVKFYHKEGYVVCAILGSCSDDRPGSKSVFFVKGPYSYGCLMQMIRESEVAQKIINALPFPLVSKMEFPINIKA